jgi:ribosomal protein L11 methyltransferase
MEAGALGTETADSENETRITGYFGQPIDETRLRDALHDALRIYNRGSGDGVNLNLRELAERDWLEEWKKDWKAVGVGRFVIAPPWIQSETPAVAGAPAADLIVIKINPGMAFGTGTHETTRLCLKAIEKYFRGGSFLDVGTGTGILAIAAARMFPNAQIHACDIDEDAIAIAKDNAHRNSVLDRIDFQVGGVNEQTPSADLVCANLTAVVIVELLPLLLDITCGRLVLSGILDSQVELVQTRLLQFSASILEMEIDGDWVAMVI